MRWISLFFLLFIWFHEKQCLVFNSFLLIHIEINQIFERINSLSYCLFIYLLAFLQIEREVILNIGDKNNKIPILSEYNKRPKSSVAPEGPTKQLAWTDNAKQVCIGL